MTAPNATRVIFAGTPEFSTGTLEALIEAGYDVVAVYTQPECHHIPVYQPLSLRQEAAQA